MVLAANAESNGENNICRLLFKNKLGSISFLEKMQKLIIKHCD